MFDLPSSYRVLKWLPTPASKKYQWAEVSSPYDGLGRLRAWAEKRRAFNRRPLSRFYVARNDCQGAENCPPCRAQCTGQPAFGEGDLPADFRTIDKLRDWLPIRREQCGKDDFRKSKWWRSSERRIAIRWRRWPSGTASASRRSTLGERFGGLQASDVKRLRQLEVENGRLKKLVAERDLEIEVMKEVAAKKW